jgi:hypothetical protein
MTHHVNTFIGIPMEYPSQSLSVIIVMVVLVAGAVAKVWLGGWRARRFSQKTWAPITANVVREVSEHVGMADVLVVDVKNSSDFLVRSWPINHFYIFFLSLLVECRNGSKFPKSLV